MRCVCDEVPSSSVRYFLPAFYIVPHFQDTSYIQIAQWGPKRAICGSHHFDNISLLFEQGKFFILISLGPRMSKYLEKKKQINKQFPYSRAYPGPQMS